MIRLIGGKQVNCSRFTKRTLATDKYEEIFDGNTKTKKDETVGSVNLYLIAHNRLLHIKQNACVKELKQRCEGVNNYIRSLCLG